MFNYSNIYQTDQGLHINSSINQLMFSYRIKYNKEQSLTLNNQTVDDMP